VDLKLAKLITGGAGPRHSFFVQISAVAAALALAVGIGWLSLRHPSPKPAQPQVAKNIQSIAPPPQQAPAQPAIVKTPVIATFVLTPGSVRADGEANEIRIPPNAQQVRFRIDLLSNQYQTYDASLNRVEGQRLFVQTHIKPHPLQSGETLFILMPASTVPLGTSILTIRGVGKYVIHNSQN
jgi:hypothetical protein